MTGQQEDMRMGEGQTRVTAQLRNKYVCDISDKVLIVTANSKSSLVPLSDEFKSKQLSPAL
jgi:hypothetical protein